jgi:signal transduction histidine kinase
MATMQRLSGPSSSAPIRLGSGMQSPYSSAPRNAHIIVIDDDDDTRDVICGRLARAGYHCQGFDAARAALDAMDAGLRPDLILLDLVMPGMSGWEFRIEQKRRPSMATIPTITLSGDLSPYAAAIDASAQLTKPVDGDQLCEVIDRVLSYAQKKQQTLRTVEVDRARALGMLVASVAHEINNPLTYVSGNVELALQALAEGPPDGDEARVVPLLEAARDGAQRVAFIVQLLTTFVHSDEHDTRVLDPLRALDAATRLAMHYIRPRARLVFMPSATPLVRANEARLAQIFLNLLVNAAQSIPAGHPSSHEVRIRTDAREDRCIIEISDTGPAVPPELHAHIFEPFFAADGTAVGAGLTLAITRGMVERLGGTLSHSAADRVGSTFRVELPIAEQPAALDAPSQRASRAPVPAGRAPRVLVIDDEPLVGRLVEAALVGHEVELVTEPSAGLLLLNDGDYDVVLCDLKMPDISGIEVHAWISARRPDLCARFVLMTGAAADNDVESFVERSGVPVLRKPFAIRDLRAMVQRLVAVQAPLSRPRD